MKSDDNSKRRKGFLRTQNNENQLLESERQIERVKKADQLTFGT